MSKAFLDWFSIVSLAINVILAVVSVYFIVVGIQANRRSKAQVKIWLEQANGVNQALLRIIQDKWNNLYSSVSDITNAIHTVQASALALWTALYEERVITEVEYKDRQKKIWKKLDEQIGLTQEETTKTEIALVPEAEIVEKKKPKATT